MASAKKMARESRGEPEPKKKKELSATAAAERMRSVRKMEGEIVNIPPVPDNLTPDLMRDAVYETARLVNQALTWATESGKGTAQESMTLSRASKACVEQWTTLFEVEQFGQQSNRITCSCQKCRSQLDTALRDSLFKDYAANAWRAVHLARLALPKSRGDYTFHGMVKDWAYTVSNCLEQAAKSGHQINETGGTVDPMIVYMSNHREEQAAMMDKLAIASSALDVTEAKTFIAGRREEQPKPLSRLELADLGV